MGPADLSAVDMMGLQSMQNASFSFLQPSLHRTPGPHASDLLHGQGSRKIELCMHSFRMRMNAEDEDNTHKHMAFFSTRTLLVSFPRDRRFSPHNACFRPRLDLPLGPGLFEVRSALKAVDQMSNMPMPMLVMCKSANRAGAYISSYLPAVGTAARAVYKHMTDFDFLFLRTVCDMVLSMAERLYQGRCLQTKQSWRSYARSPAQAC